MTLSKYFDSVIMLTWSNWKTEPRSNRFHYASRFALELPVFFVQPWGNSKIPISSESSGVNGINLIQTRGKVEADQLSAFKAILNRHGVKRPLLWIYNSMHYRSIIDSFNNSFRVYHATEDYLTESVGWSLNQKVVAESVIKLLPSIDLLVGVSAGVVRSYKERGNYSGRSIIVENGCDAEFFFETCSPYIVGKLMPDNKKAIYQGGINSRLDFKLLYNVALRLPDWNFCICGAADSNLSEWTKLQSLPNVKYFGLLPPRELAELMCSSTVGLIPFQQDDWINNSLPLKSFEYVACGLPVVTVPIEALRRNKDLFSVARTADEFVIAIQKVALTRNDPHMLELRKRSAEESSYNKKFTEVCLSIDREIGLLTEQPKKLNIALLYDDGSTHVSTIREHLDAFRNYSRHQIYYFPGTRRSGKSSAVRQTDLDIFDVLILHYSVRLSLKDHLSEEVAIQMENFHGLKILFIQDEYDFTETARTWMDRIKFDIVYTCISATELEIIYPTSRFPKTEFLSTITGYVPEDRSIENYAMPIRDRKAIVGYRGRKLHYAYGTLGYEKYRIGLDVRKLAEERGVPVDIEVDDALRIYGVNWYQFLGSVRATLGTESGSNVFDFDGSITQTINDLIAQFPNLSFEEMHRRVISKHEDLVRMNQISPKIFEAIRLRTALVLFEGEYSGVVKPDVHFIPLKKDYSNIDDVFLKLKDFEYLEQITERAYKDIIETGFYSYKNFIAGVDAAIKAWAVRGQKFEIFSSPMLARNIDGDIRIVNPKDPFGFSLSTGILRDTFQREQLSACISMHGSIWNSREQAAEQTNVEEEAFPRYLKYISRAWHCMPLKLRVRIYRFFANMLIDLQKARNYYIRRFLRPIWRIMPEKIRKQILSLTTF